MKKGIIIGISSFALIGSVLAANSTKAFNGVPNGQVGTNYSLERHNLMTQAFEENNYTKWKELMGDKGATKKINEGNFSKFSEAHKLMLEGKTNEANEIRKELGLGTGSGKSHNSGRERGQNKGGNFVDENKDGVCDKM